MSSSLDPSVAPPSPPLHPNEWERLISIRGLHVGDEESDPMLDEIAGQAAALFGTSFGTVTLVREHDQFFFGNSGMAGHGGDRNEAICAYTILQIDPLVVENASEDPRFAHFAAVTGNPHLRFYAGAPMFDASGLPIGSVCALGPERVSAGMRQLFALQRLATQASGLLETRRVVVDLLGPNPHPHAVKGAVSRLERALAPLLASSVR